MIPEKEAAHGNVRSGKYTQYEEPTDSARKPSLQALWKSRKPKAVWAQHALRSAMKRGLISQQPCEECGKSPAEAHHDDYDKPMVVRCLCRSCHKQQHTKLRRRTA
jgi:hypothetical protein